MAQLHFRIHLLVSIKLLPCTWRSEDDSDICTLEQQYRQGTWRLQAF